jgi:hypothetical protein
MSKRILAEQAITDAVREGTRQATARAVAICDSCIKHGAASEMTALILSNKSPSEVESELKAKAAAASWDRAITKTGGQS